MEFVTFELAKKLKEKGFPQGNKEDFRNYYYKISDGLQMAIMVSNGEEVEWYCPNISEVLKWLRDEKKLYIMPYNALSREYNIKWDFEIDDLNTSDIIYESRLIYNSYEEAALAGIEYVLNNLI